MVVGVTGWGCWATGGGDGLGEGGFPWAKKGGWEMTVIPYI